MFEDLVREFELCVRDHELANMLREDFSQEYREQSMRYYEEAKAKLMDCFYDQNDPRT